MCNCGKKRTELSRHSHPANIPANVNTKMRIPLQTSASFSFEYIGKTALTIIGGVTGMKYRFAYPGDKQNIDYRDLPGIKNIPVLRRV